MKLVALLLLGLGSLSARSETTVQFVPGAVQGSFLAQTGFCPCFRLTTQVRLAGGQIETRNFLISSDSLLKLDQLNNVQTPNLMGRKLRLGAMEALWKGGHIGVGTTGVTFGHDQDANYASFIQTSAFALLSLFRNEDMRLDLRGGYLFEGLKIGLSDEMIRRHLLTQSASFGWDTGSWQGNLSAYAHLPADNPTSLETSRYGVEALSAWDVLPIDGWDFHLGVLLKAEQDRIRTKYGLDPTTLSAQVFMEISWIGDWNVGQR